VTFLLDQLPRERPDIVVLDSNALWAPHPGADAAAAHGVAARFITHGGMNSVLEGLAYGVPLLLIPQHVEQLVIGLTVAERGAGLMRRAHVAGQQLDVGALRHDVEQMLQQPGFKSAASAMQALVRESGGYRAGADEVQAYVGSDARSHPHR